MPPSKPVFPGTYFNGKTATKFSVQVQPTSQQLIIRLDNNRQRVWDYESVKIVNTDTKQGPARLEFVTGDKTNLVTELLIVDDSAFLDRVDQVAHGRLGTFWNQRKHKKVRNVLFWSLVVLVPPLLYFIWTFGIPAMTDQIAQNVPPKWEAKLGDKVFESLFVPRPVKPNPETKKMLDTIQERLLSAEPDQPYTFRIYILPSDQVNALALPGGIIVVFQGLLNKTENPEELAGVLAHEFQHVLLRHSTRGIIRQLAKGVLLAIVVGDANTVMSTVLGAAEELEGLAFSRKMETEADTEGMEMMRKAGIDPQGMVRIFRKLQEEERKMLEKINSEDLLPEWMKYLSTHPAAGDRVEMLNEMAQRPGFQEQPLLKEEDWTVVHKIKDKTEKKKD